MLKRILVLALGVAVGLGAAALALRTSNAWWFLPHHDLNTNVDHFSEALDTVAKNYVNAGDADYSRLTKAALQGMLGSLDPHSEYLDPKDLDDMEDEMNGGFGGIGIQVEVRDGKIVVVAPIPNTPGERAGIRRGDQITRIEGKLLDKPSMDTVVGQLRGKPKTKVSLTFFRPAEKRTFDLTLTREIIKLASVRGARMVGPGLGYVEITQFTEQTGDDFTVAVAGLEVQGLRGLIIDLRNNPGGLLDAAADVVEPFFNPNELIVFTQGRTPDSREELRAGKNARGTRYPIAVLVNSGSASAAEIVAGALKDTGRAVIVGERTFGKGSVQTIIPLSHNGGGLRLTTAKYYTPLGISIHQKGIEPQVSVVETVENDDRLRLQRDNEGYITSTEEFKERYGFTPIADRQLQAAIDSLQGTLAYTQSLAPHS